jgi:hypothetical protein
LFSVFPAAIYHEAKETSPLKVVFFVAAAASQCIILTHVHLCHSKLEEYANEQTAGVPMNWVSRDCKCLFMAGRFGFRNP